MIIVVETDNSVKEKLKKTTFGKDFVQTCLNSEFLVVEEEDSKWLGICFVGGLLHTNGIEILEEARGRGISKKLLDRIIDECNKRRISFLTGVFKPTNLVSIKIHTAIGYKPVFNFYYNKQVGEEITVTWLVAISEQLLLVPVTVYVIVVCKTAVTELFVLLFNPVFGDQE